MKKTIQHLIAIAFIAVVAAGCASAPSQFYTLNSTAKAEGAPAAHYAVVIEMVSIPALVDRPQFTVQVAPNRVAIDEFNRWAEPLNDNIADVIAGDLAVLLGTPRVAAAHLANIADAYRVTVNIQRFESVPGKLVRVEALWLIRPPTGGVSLSGCTTVSELVAGANYEALAAAHSRALAKVSADIAAVIRTEADEKP